MPENNMNFQPMPKRFMVWDRQNKVFLTRPLEIWQIVNHFQGRVGDLVNDDLQGNRYLFCQSTNLFAKDDKEIFEGSIVENGHGWIGVVVQYKGQWIVNYRKATPVTVWHLLYDIKNDMKLIGHILSNPDLVEEK